MARAGNLSRLDAVVAELEMEIEALTSSLAPLTRSLGVSS
jgi:hypothetical protein